jgi:hypothetical protein
MTFWLTGDEEPDDERFRAVPGGLGLYAGAGAWCMSKVRYRPEAEIPAEWFVPYHFIKWWPNGPRIAAGLERQSIWERARDADRNGYRFGWIRSQNTPDAVRRQRKHEREKKAKQRAMSPRESSACPPGDV